jgi:Tol biopolymer transport system component
MQKAFLPLVLVICSFGVCQEGSPNNSTAQPVAVRALAYEVHGMGLESVRGFYLPSADIFVKASPTSQPKLLVAGLRPTWSPDGQKLAYCPRVGPDLFGQVELINVDGSGHMQLTKLKDGACPTDWSQDGEKIAFTTYGAKDTRSIFVMNKNGENAKPISTGYGARWSPDGRQLVFCRSAERHGASGSIWIANADGTGPTKVIDDKSQLLDVAWFPDGKSIVFSSEREHKRSKLFRINVDGTGLEAIAADKHLSLFFPLPSPDGREVIADGYSGGTDVTNVVLVDLTSHHTSVLAHGKRPSVLWGKP